ncbi:MAG: outer membrane protein assembly factor BamD [Alphaproteobacteria bacterium]|nr:outer membrane protein assembly factor BamD [Alphaproteobacteria bacterium]MBL0717855.1 outer membrane protein assembly factor BamD [Alphaproteobacteria bacterium]
MKIFVKLFFIPVICLFMSSCAVQYQTEMLSATELYEEARAKELNDEPFLAIDKYKKIEQYYPYSSESSYAMIRASYLLYSKKEYTEALILIDRFSQFFPVHKQSLYMKYLEGRTFESQIKQVGRDQTFALKAFDIYQEIIELYPDSIYIADVKFRRELIQDILAYKIVKIGVDNSKKGFFPSAIHRFNKAIELYPESSVIPEAIYRSMIAHKELHLTEESRKLLQTLEDKYPNSRWTKYAKTDL